MVEVEVASIDPATWFRFDGTDLHGKHGGSERPIRSDRCSSA
jgi:hypothetical protein